MKILNSQGNWSLISVIWWRHRFTQRVLEIGVLRFQRIPLPWIRHHLWNFNAQVSSMNVSIFKSCSTWKHWKRGFWRTFSKCCLTEMSHEFHMWVTVKCTLHLLKMCYHIWQNSDHILFTNLNCCLGLCLLLKYNNNILDATLLCLIF